MKGPRLRLLTTGDRTTERLIWILGPFALIAIAIREWRFRRPSGSAG